MQQTDPDMIDILSINLGSFRDMNLLLVDSNLTNIPLFLSLKGMYQSNNRGNSNILKLFILK
jgi:hypothetical protein